LADGALQRAHDPNYPWDTAKMLAGQGLLGITIPESDGGVGGTLMDAGHCDPGSRASVCPKSADIVQAGNFGPSGPSPEYADRGTEGPLSSRSAEGAQAHQPRHDRARLPGSAVTDLTTSAKKDWRFFVINGSKIFTTHSTEAELFLVYVRYGPGLERNRFGADRARTPGFTSASPHAS
jgi:alkylation response protein AidB-like acyl-CoA dehydrogenase